MADEDVDDDQQVTISADDLKNLRRIASEHDEAKKKVESYERERAFSQAGLDLNDAKTSYFIKAYDGDMTPEAIKAKAEEVGFIGQAPPPPSGPSQQELQTHGRMANAAAGAPGTPPFDMDAALREAKTPDEIMQIMTQQGYPTTWNRT